MTEPDDRAGNQTSGRERLSHSAVHIPSRELLQAVRCAVLAMPTARDRAEVVLKVVMEMVNTSNSSGVDISEQEVSSSATVLEAIADHVLRMQDLTGQRSETD